MVCGNCGNEMRDGAKFCPRCGALNSPGTGGGAVPPWEQPEGGGKKKTGLLIGGIVAAAAVIALLAVVAGGLFSSPKQKLEKAMVKSFAAYAQAEEALGLPDLQKLTEERSVSQRMSLRLTNLNTAMTGYDLSDLEGLGLRFQSDLDGADRKIGMELAAFWDDRELLSVQLAVDDAEVCFASPQFTEGDFYGVNTETLGEDLKKLGVQDVGDISFNFFDLVEAVAPEGRTEEMEQAMKEANRALFDAVQVKKGGRETIFVNQTETRTDVYQATIPKDAMKDYVNAVAGVLSGTDYAAFYREVCRAMGVPEDVLEELLGELEDLDPYGGLAESLGEFLDERGDVELTVHVAGGYVSAVVYGGYAVDDGIRLALYLGGGEEYVDNLRLEMDVDGQKVIIDSSGDHGCKSGVFTDQTTIRGPFSTVTSEFRYEPGKTQDNLSWGLSIPGAGSLEMAGQLTGGEESVELHLDELCFKVLGMEVCSVEMDYYMGPCEGQSVAIRNPKLIGEMDGFELMTAALALQANARAWMEDMQTVFISRLPSDLRWAIMGAF